MKQITTLLLTLFGSMINILGQTSDVITKIPFELEGNHIFIKLKINNSKELNFVFDTGADGTVINSETANRINLSNYKQSKEEGANGEIAVQVSKKNTININNLQFDNLNLVSVPLLHLEKVIGRDIDGIIGYPILKKYVVKLNYDSFEIEIYPSKNFKYVGTGETIKILSKPISTINAKIGLENGQFIEGRFILDNGAGLAIALCTPFSEENNIVEKFNNTYLITSLGLSGKKTTVTMGRLKTLKINKLQHFDVPTNVYSVKTGVFAREGIAGIIGNEVLKKYNITFDYKRKNSYWESNNTFYNEQFEVSCSGLRLSLDETKTKIFIINIIPKSIGAYSELEIGDEIIKIDGIEVEKLTLSKIEKLLNQDSKTIEIMVNRKNSLSKVFLKLKALI